MSNKYVLGMDRGTLNRYELFDEIYQPATEKGLARITVNPDANILEIGCGIGHTACWIAENVVPDGHVTAFDISEDFIELAKERADRMGLSNVRFLCDKAETFDYGHEKFDLIHTRYVLTYISEARAVVQKAAHSLVPGGCFFGEECVATFITHNNPEWSHKLFQWFSSLVKKGGGNPNYGIEELPSDLIEAGLERLSVLALAALDDQKKVTEVLRMVLAEEMRDNIINAEIATAEEVDAMIEASRTEYPDALYSPAMVAQCIAYKPL